MQKVRTGDVVVLKAEAGEPEMTAYAVQKVDGILCTIVPLVELKYAEDVCLYKGSQIAMGSRPEIFACKGALAGICCFSTELADIFCRNPAVDRLIHGE